MLVEQVFLNKMTRKNVANPVNKVDISQHFFCLPIYINLFLLDKD